jgi:hypothetical protein
MHVSVDIAEEGKAPEVLSLEASGEDSAAAIADRLAGELGLEAGDVLEAFRAEHGLERGALAREFPASGLRLRRVRVEVHFEGETASHAFPSRARWERVHRWACRHFAVAADACANLELHDGAPDGPRLNDNQPIGTSSGRRGVYLIKPGPEPYGAI